MRILITGSRDWTDWETIHETLASHTLGIDSADITLVSGGCPRGADKICEQYAIVEDWNVEVHPANWKKYGSAGGYKRNALMVGLGADICIAFIRNGSKGSSMTANLARRAGIPTIVITEHRDQYASN